MFKINFKERDENLRQLQMEIEQRKKAELLIVETNQQLEESVQKFFDMTQILEEKNNELEKAYSLLHMSRANIYTMIEKNADSIVIVDKNGIILFVNQSAVNLFNRKKEELIGSSFGYPVLMGESEVTEIEIIHYPKKRIIAEMRLVEIEWDQNDVYLASLRDITKRREMEEEVKRIEESKLESVGVLAGGIAHDFNNILTTIMGEITLARMYASREDKVLERLTGVEKAVLRAKDLTYQLLTFSMGGSPIKKIVSVQNLLKDTTSFALSGSNIKCSLSTPDDLWNIECDEGQISQVVNNLIFNAKDAMPEGGMIDIEAKNIIRENKQYVRIAVRDYGLGIPEEHREKIFDPYFTTKQNGSGLGLATAYSIVKKHNGYIELESEPDKGTVFFVLLPASEERLILKEEKKEETVNGHGKILFVDDEEDILSVMSSILKEFGYQVEVAINGQDAIDSYKKAMESGHSFDAVITDLTLPGGMGGKEIMKKLLIIDPDVKAIVSSGYSTDAVMADFVSYGFKDVVPKPYDPEYLCRVLHRVVENG